MRNASAKSQVKTAVKKYEQVLKKEIRLALPSYLRKPAALLIRLHKKA